MSITSFPVAYYDETGVWNLFSKHIYDRLPISGVSLNSIEGEILLPPLPITFIPHAKAFWQSDAEHRYLKPYLWIFVLKYTNHETFRRETKLKLKELIHTMQEKHIEWLVLFVPTLTYLVKSDQKSFSASYEKLQGELQGMFGQKHTARFYCGSNKTYVDLSQPSAIKDEYWTEFARAVGKGVSGGIQNTLQIHARAGEVSEEADPLKHCLNQQAMAIVYGLCGLRTQEERLYEGIFFKKYREGVFTGRANLEEFEANTVLDVEGFRNALFQGNISELEFFRYVFERIRTICEISKNLERYSQVTCVFLDMCKRIFHLNRCGDATEHEYSYLYSLSAEASYQILSKINGNRYAEISKDTRPVCYYYLAMIQDVMKCSLYKVASGLYQLDYRTTFEAIFLCKPNLQSQSPDLSPKSQRILPDQSESPEDPRSKEPTPRNLPFQDIISNKSLCQEQLMLANRRISEYFSYSDHSRTGLKYKSEASIFALQLNRLDLLTDIIDQFSSWPSIDSVHINYLVHSNLLAKNYSQAIKNLIDICGLNYFPLDLLKEMWEKATCLSKTHSALTSLLSIRVHCSKSVGVNQGEFHEEGYTIVSSQQFPVRFQKIVARFIREDVVLTMECGETVINPGRNYVEVGGLVWAQSKLKLESICGVCDKLSCEFMVSPQVLVINPYCGPAIAKLKLPPILIQGQVQTCTIEICTNNEEILESVLVLQYHKVIFI